METSVLNFPVQIEKVVQAIGVLFRQDRVKRMNYMRLLKLLYIADREAMKETGRPITGGAVVAKERGPVLQEVYDLIRGRHVDMPLWDRFLQKDRFSLELVSDPDVRKLSKYEIDKLQQIAQRHENEDEWDLSALTHSFPEWKKNDPGTSSRPIPLDDILEAVGFPGSSATEIIEDADYLARVHADLGR